MPEETLILVKPDIEYASEYLAMVDEFVLHDGEYPYNNAELAREDFCLLIHRRSLFVAI